MNTIQKKIQTLLKNDPNLKPYLDQIINRLNKIDQTQRKITQNKISLANFASGHEYFGLHLRKDFWIFREWAPNAKKIYLIGDLNNWKENDQFALRRITNDGVWEIKLPKKNLAHTNLYRLKIHWSESSGDRIPAYARRVVQDPKTLIFNAQVWKPKTPYNWKITKYNLPKQPPLIYEAHIGMAQEEEKIGNYQEFTQKIIPKIKEAGYNTIQLMAIQEHPYYASFGYQVSNFFAPSSRFGTPEDLKTLIDTAHKEKLTVLMDLVHSHSVSNEVEGLARFDGTPYQYFHNGQRGEHQAWQTRCFNYNKPQVLHFLLSNCRYWLDEFHFDGFRFDGVTSMIYKDHGLHRIFTSYEDYFNELIDEDALSYLALANKLIHKIKPRAITIAEDVSGMPGLAAPIQNGGFGFDYRFAMGIPDYWIKIVKTTKDENWHLGHLWYELNNHRKDEKTISYVECHDQALVGDQTIIFRLAGENLYSNMQINDHDLQTGRAIALSKMIKLITLATAKNGYLNFMGNEFGHPDWIDFPTPHNNMSYKHARRQWSLAENPSLKYKNLAQFDKDLIDLTKKQKLFEKSKPQLLHIDEPSKIITFQRAELIFAFNFHPNKSQLNYKFQAPPGEFYILLDTDSKKYAGYSRQNPNQKHFTTPIDQKNTKHQLSLYLPSRSAIALKQKKN